MAVFYKVAISGTYQGQAIVNVLYYGNDAGEGFEEWSFETQQNVGDAVALAIVDDYVASLPTTYTLNELVVSGVNERNVVVGDFESNIPVNEPGLAAVNTEGQAQVAIISFQTVRAIDGDRNVKRSYLAYGPLHDSAQNSDGSLDADYITGLTNLLGDLVSEVPASPLPYQPVRIGRTVAPEPIAVGRVIGITLRPFASFRKSRKRRPTGL